MSTMMFRPFKDVESVTVWWCLLVLVVVLVVVPVGSGCRPGGGACWFWLSSWWWRLLVLVVVLVVAPVGSGCSPDGGCDVGCEGSSMMSWFLQPIGRRWRCLSLVDGVVCDSSGASRTSRRVT
ncbi:hypothetical protein EYF80_060180 [Liparis tanakae]|uniref:Uncharacterized protein n=1 Tax=Liparis tanakae TaxID=230148 RepID=A0A4Z2EM74_9TELE|nr:hypothetical protein EYF80_060180 [Liparis tanakae]